MTDSTRKMLRGPLRFVVIGVALAIIIYVVHFYLQWSSAKDRILDVKQDGTVAGFSKFLKSSKSDSKSSHFDIESFDNSNSFQRKGFSKDFGQGDGQHPFLKVENNGRRSGLFGQGILQQQNNYLTSLSPLRSSGPSETKHIHSDGASENQIKGPLPMAEQPSQRKSNPPRERNEVVLSKEQSSINTVSDLLQPPEEGLKNLFDKKLVLVHLDLKGAPPKLTYLKQIFPLFKQWGANGLLIEYEDTFPYSGVLSEIPAGYAYTPEDIKEIQKYAAGNGLVVIPLIQTFGHMEFVLKHKKFMDLREVSNMPLAISACHSQAMQLIKLMLFQVLTLHPNASYLHIGSDEVYHLGMGEQCSMHMVKEKLTKADLFLKHAVDVATSLKEMAPKVQPIMWDDMLRKINTTTLKKYKLAEVVEPMVWNYVPHVESRVTPDIWSKYAEVFKNVWIASSFKGATGPHQYITDISYHLRNHFSWMQVVKKYVQTGLNLKGVALTGWQRFDHFGVLCELLPSGLPSLAVCLTALKNGGFGEEELQTVTESLGCNATLPLSLPAKYNTPINISCTFPGNKIYTILQEYHKSRLQYDYIVSNLAAGWLSDYNVKHGYASPYQVGKILNMFQNLLANVSQQAKVMQTGLSAMFPGETSLEWLEEYVSPIKMKVKEVYQKTEGLLKRMDWSKRPFVTPGSNQLATALINDGMEIKGKTNGNAQPRVQSHQQEWQQGQQQPLGQQPIGQLQGKLSQQYGQQPLQLNPRQQGLQYGEQQSVSKQGQQLQYGQQESLFRQQSQHQNLGVQDQQGRSQVSLQGNQFGQQGQGGGQQGLQREQQQLGQQGQQLAQQGQHEQKQEKGKTTEIVSSSVGLAQPEKLLKKTKDQQLMDKIADKQELSVEETIKAQQRSKMGSFQENMVKKDEGSHIPMRSRQKIIAK
ncbi:uncharacterized protein LOC106171956 [Lingula anatina]|uniref:beta-N-acetylhexosaminidase n=1 Tax=Lingula anatina TaxID=7574 RepID=A0A1S3JC16_LINAN|nr:uncharacterized protein LOC106171956 [Lingula anatina]|eukprot:XP_013407947.1 uncharacterized protein LOC106171956 [Lingula anatina]